MLVLLLFFCSGATALVYEVIWSKYLGLILGSTVQAQTVVLAVFMGGLAIGNRVFGRKSARVMEPLRWYGILELIIGAYALLFPYLFRLGDQIFAAAGAAVVDIAGLAFILKLGLSVVLLLTPTILMGGTLPLIAARIERQKDLDKSSRVGIFYAVNSLGAVFGAGLAGFFLVQTIGLSSSLEVIAIANMLIGLLAVVVAKRESKAELLAPPMEPVAPASGRKIAPGIALGVLVALTGAVSMGLEVLSARALALIVGGSLQSFALVLMSFILGIGLGSVAISSSRTARGLGANAIYILLFGAACFVVIQVMLIERWAIIYTNAKFGLAPNDVGYWWHQLAVGMFAFIFLGLPAACLGAVVPLAIRLGHLDDASMGDEVGRLLTWNTLGAVTGVLITGFVLMPLLGLRGAFSLLGLLLLGAGALIASRREQPRVVMVAGALAVLALVGIVSTGEKWRHVMSAGIFRVRNLYMTDEVLLRRQQEVELLYYKDSADATVSVERGRGAEAQVTLRINGKSDASSAGDLGTQKLMAHLPMLVRPNATNVFILGFGSGITAGAVLGHPVQQLVVAENCGPVLEAGHFFAPWNRGVLTNTRARMVQDDGRNVLKLYPTRYDVIISAPSNPWMAGIGSVFSQDYYALCASRLAPGGVMCQWFQQYEMSNDIVFLVLRTFASVYPYMEIWDSQAGDMVLLGSKTPWRSEPALWQFLFERTEPAKDMAEIGIRNPAALWARQMASQITAAAIPGDGPVQTDEFPILEYAAPKAFFKGGLAQRIHLFDERTVQFPLNRRKLTALQALPREDLLSSFQKYLPGNPDIRLYLDSSQGQQARLGQMAYVVFRPPESFPEQPGTGGSKRPDVLELVRAESALLRQPDQWRENAGRIEKILTEMLARNEVNPPDFKPEYFAAVTARHAIGHGDFQTALRVLRVGFAFAPSDEQLVFLSRVLDRVVPPDVLERARKADSYAP